MTTAPDRGRPSGDGRKWLDLGPARMRQRRLRRMQAANRQRPDQGGRDQQLAQHHPHDRSSQPPGLSHWLGETDRDGIVLVVVLVLLGIFALVGVTFVISTGQNAASSMTIAQVEQRQDPYRVVLSRALEQILVGSNNPASALQGHGLLEDMYGPPSYKGTIPSNPFVDQQTGFMIFQNLRNNATPFGYLSLLKPTEGYYNGQVLTMLTGPAQGQSTRIVKYLVSNPNVPTHELAMLPFESGILPQQGDLFLINGKPFNGVGAGMNGLDVIPDAYLNPSLPRNEQLYPELRGQTAIGEKQGSSGNNTEFGLLNIRNVDGIELALLPNHTSQAWQQLFQLDRDRINGIRLPGLSAGSEQPRLLPPLAPSQHFDEPYDAPDFQNPFLAFMVPLDGRFTGSGKVTVAPSFHRPALLNYLAARVTGGSQTYAQLYSNQTITPNNAGQLPLLRALQGSTMRPLPQLHERFRQNNPWFEVNPLFDSDPAGQTTPWDVDNDADGEADSIWVDIGLDVLSDHSGRQYKPLVAMLIQDLDGKLNLSVHGQLNDTFNGNGDESRVDFNASATSPRVRQKSRLVIPANNLGAAQRAPASFDQAQVLAAGQGLSPTSINLSTILSEIEFRNLKYGRVLERGDVVTGIYGEPNELGNNTPPGPGITGADDNFPPPLTAAGQPPVGNSATVLLYKSGVDFNGDGAIAVDAAGRPVFHFMGTVFGKPEHTDEGFELETTPRAVANNTGAGMVHPDEPLTWEDYYYLLNPTAVDVSAGAVSPLSSVEPASDYDYTLADTRGNPNLATRIGSRVQMLLSAFTQGNLFARHLISGANSDVPAPSFSPTPEMLIGLDLVQKQLDQLLRNGTSPQQLRQQYPEMVGLTTADLNIIDMIIGKVAFVQAVENSSVDLDEIRRILYGDPNRGYRGLLVPHDQGGAGVVPDELLAGLRLNLNRPLGDGVDNNGNGAVDEGLEAGSETLYNTNVDRVSDGTLDGWDSQPQAQLARQLYFLMMLVSDHRYSGPARVRLGEGNALASENIGNVNIRRELMTLRIAQWCVNAVDFKDPDGIMTGMEFDLRPFRGWNVDGIITPMQPNANTVGGDDGHPDRRVVWGCEAPHLMLTESTAFHDLRVRDKEAPQGETNRTEDQDGDEVLVGEEDLQDGDDPLSDVDNDPDQERVPQGSLFVELFCPSSPKTAVGNVPDQRTPYAFGYPDELYNRQGNLVGLDLNRVSPRFGNPGDANYVPPYSVWRLAITEHSLDTDQGRRNDVDSRWEERPQTASFQPQPFSQNGSGNNLNPNAYAQPEGWRNHTLVNPYLSNNRNPVRIERIVWLANFRPDSAVVDRQKIYFNQRGPNGHTPNNAGALNLVQPGGYAVVGPQRGEDFAGARTYIGSGRGPAEPLGSNANKRQVEVIDLSGDRVRVGLENDVDGGNVDPYDRTLPPALPVPCAWVVPHEVTTGVSFGEIGLSVSEPLPRLNGDSINPSTYYSMTNVQQFPDGYRNLTGRPVMDQYAEGQNPDKPLDWRPGRPLFEIANDLNNVQLYHAPRTWTRFRYVFLQRLADPTRPWNAADNPYISVDTMPVDLTVFNGEGPRVMNMLQDGNGNPTEWGNLDHSNTNDNVQFATRSRGRQRTAQQSDQDVNVWEHVFLEPEHDGRTAPGNFSRGLRHTLGYLNEGLQRGNNADKWYSVATHPWLAGHPRARRPNPWLTWNDRPYISPMELLLVPASNPARLFWEFSDATFANGQSLTGVYARRHTNPNWSSRPNAPFGHLLEFFVATSSNPTVSQGVATNGSENTPGPNFFRIFDLVGVPSPLSRTEKWLDPSVFRADGPARRQLIRGLTAPHNRISTYREPGRVNLNTMFEFATERVWLAVTNRFGDRDQDGITDNTFRRYAPAWNDVVDSRSGYNLAYSSSLNVDYPTRFANPFTPANGYYVPVNALRRSTNGNWRSFVDGGLLRRIRDINTVGGQGIQPLFAFTWEGRDSATNLPRPDEVVEDGVTVLGEFNNSLRNAAFRYELINRLANVTTTRSNVYAIWITVGYFEAFPSPPLNGPDGQPGNNDDIPAGSPSEFYPDGYQLGLELGADTGEVRRHRAFYIVDRTLPVASERGVLHNAWDCVVFQRLME